MKIFVTGGSGFVGRNLVNHLSDEGYEVTIVAAGGEPRSRAVKTTYMTLTGIDWECLKNQDVVIHLMANNDTLCSDETEMNRANVSDSILLLEKAIEYGCKKFIYASSTAIYGSSPAPYIEGQTPEIPLNVYGRSKKMFEDAVKQMNVDIPVIGFRYCNIYGPGEENKGHRMSMVGQILRTMIKGKRPTLFKWGEQRRDWVYVTDVVKANVLALESKISGIYNIGSGTSNSFKEIVDLINEFTNQNIEPNYVDCPFPEEYQNYTECNIEKARKELGYFSSFDLKSGIQNYLSTSSLVSESSSY